MKSVGVSSGEKLILRMLCDLFQHLKVESDIDPAFVKDALLGDHCWALEWEGLLDEITDRTDVVKEVADILSMWRMVEWSYEKLSEHDKERVRVETGHRGEAVSFDGFDGNEETSYMAVAEFIVEKMPGRFDHFKGRYLNSHSPSLYRYRPMVRAYKEITSRPRFTGQLLAADEIINILKEG